MVGLYGFLLIVVKACDVDDFFPLSTLEFVNAVLNVRLFLKLRESTERPTSLSDELVCDLYDNNSEESFGIALWRLRQGAEEVPVIPATINDQ